MSHAWWTALDRPPVATKAAECARQSGSVLVLRGDDLQGRGAALELAVRQFEALSWTVLGVTAPAHPSGLRRALLDALDLVQPAASPGALSSSSVYADLGVEGLCLRMAERVGAAGTRVALAVNEGDGDPPMSQPVGFLRALAGLAGTAGCPVILTVTPETTWRPTDVPGDAAVIVDLHGVSRADLYTFMVTSPHMSHLSTSEIEEALATQFPGGRQIISAMQAYTLLRLKGRP